MLCARVVHVLIFNEVNIVITTSFQSGGVRGPDRYSPFVAVGIGQEALTIMVTAIGRN